MIALKTYFDTADTLQIHRQSFYVSQTVSKIK